MKRGLVIQDVKEHPMMSVTGVPKSAAFQGRG